MNQNLQALPGDELLVGADAQLTHGITIEASAEKIWPWLVQMGCHRAGFYGIDLIDNGARRSAREVHPEWQHLEVGQLIENTPNGEGAFEVLRVTAARVLVFGGLYDAAAKQRLSFDARRPLNYWHVTWAFVLEALTPTATRLHVRARAALLPRDDARGVLEGLGGAAYACLSLVSPCVRESRLHWGLDAQTAARSLADSPRLTGSRGASHDGRRNGNWGFQAQRGRHPLPACSKRVLASAWRKPPMPS